MSVSMMLIVCELDGGCIATDGTLQPKGTVFQRLACDPTAFNPGLGLALIPDDPAKVVYWPNEQGTMPKKALYPDAVNDADARTRLNLQAGDLYNSTSGVQQVGNGP